MKNTIISFAVFFISYSLCAQETIVKRLIKQIEGRLVPVEVLIKKKTMLERLEMRRKYYKYDYIKEALYKAGEQKRPVHMSGIVVDKDGHIFMPDLRLKPEEYEKFTVIAPDGKKVEAKLVGICENFACIVIRLPEGEKSRFKPIWFAKFEKPSVGDTIYTIRLEFYDNRRYVHTEKHIFGTTTLEGQGEWVWLKQMSPGTLIANKDGEIFGMALDEYLWQTKDGQSSFIGEQIVSDNMISFDELQKKMQECKNRLKKHICKFDIFFREEIEGYERQERGRIAVFGISVGKGKFLCPYPISSYLVKKIEKIKTTHRGKNYKCKFLGLYRDFGAFLIEVKDLKIPEAPTKEIENFKKGKILFTFLFEEKFGGVSVESGYNRPVKLEQGYKAQPLWKFQNNMAHGTLISDIDGNLVGFFTFQKPEKEAEEKALEVPYGVIYPFTGDSVFSRVYTFAQIKKYLDQPFQYFDKEAVPVKKVEEKKCAWFGVEFQKIGKLLAKQLNVAKQTKDGDAGILITEVYPGSPAERLGIKAGDILLCIEQKDTGKKTEIVASDPYGYYLSAYDSGRWYGQRQARWRSPFNFFNKLLMEIGIGEEVFITFLRDGKEQKVKYKIQQSPPTFETAEKYKDKDIGLTVKELTYEVRYFYRLPADSGGVVVSKVERGSKAEVAKVPLYAIITQVDKREVKDLTHFKKLIEEFKKSRRKSMTLKVLMLGETRYCEILR